VTVNRRRAAIWLWILFAFVVWNVVFDRVIVQAGRDYVDLARAAAKANAPYVKIDDTMRPARTRAFWLASASAAAILAAGLAAISSARPRRT
jgi:hypothetical protein